MPSRVVRAVLAVYPHAVRNRYGDEIAEMLANSPRPVRDLADVAWCALADRREFLTVPRLRVRDLALVTLLAAPVVFTAAYFTVLLALMVLLNRGSGGRHEVVHLITNAVMLVPMAFLAFAWGRQLRRVRSVAALNVMVPVALASVFLALLTVAPNHDFYGLVTSSSRSDGVPGALAVLSWCVGLIALAVAMAALRKRGRHQVAFVVAVVGALAVLEVSTVLHVLSLLDAQDAPRQYALLWYPAAISGSEFDLGRGSGHLAGTVGSLSVVLSVCTVFALSLMGTISRSGSAARLATVVAPSTPGPARIAVEQG
ncbi:hypothetical protein [Micromonospora eburnea]|uniref:Uncharacterized protein n=1 Tax=Micromonospora eburnea TaxID=227316 RepID=A0A1C6VNB0_9ACTN|nr:hypothetical protein [Micromonospora eburnea]SCL67755.1 hypothetical protein GA0070604_6088 [Micromonospora eburnea]